MKKLKSKPKKRLPQRKQRLSFLSLKEVGNAQSVKTTTLKEETSVIDAKKEKDDDDFVGKPKHMS